MRKLLAFVAKNNASDHEQRRYQRWLDQHADLLAYAQARQLTFWGEDTEDDADEDEDVVPPELLEAAELLDREEYNVEDIVDEVYLDLDELARFLDEARRFQPKDDDKLKKLVRLLNSTSLAGRKVLIFSEFADTARYVRRYLHEQGIDGVTQIDSGSKLNRADVLRRFSPYYNGSSSDELLAAKQDEIRVLIATDVLSEGLNLQDATRLINYDIHWNPVRLMQRIGRVDRRLSPAIEDRLKRDHPEVADDRGKVAFWNFLPPEELDDLLRLYRTVSHKTLLISKTLGIEGKKLLTPQDDYEALREFNAAYEGQTTATEELHLEYQRLLAQHPGLDAHLDAFPESMFSGRRRTDASPVGVFMCFRLPALDVQQDEFTLDAGTTHWYLDTLDGTVLEDVAEIAEFIRSHEDTPRVTTIERATLIQARDRVHKHIKNTYLKRVDAPVGVKPALKCWMELNKG
jgi:hypothetical protein